MPLSLNNTTGGGSYTARYLLPFCTIFSWEVIISYTKRLPTLFATKITHFTLSDKFQGKVGKGLLPGTSLKEAAFAGGAMTTNHVS